MADQYRKPYLESSVFISWIKGEIVNGVDRKSIVEHVLNSAKNAAYYVFISPVVLAEVHKRRGSPSLTDEENGRILKFFEHEWIKMIDINRDDGEKANLLCRQYSLTPNDALHLACALKGGCDILLSWDERLVSVVHPSIRIEQPQIITAGAAGAGGQFLLGDMLPRERIE